VKLLEEPQRFGDGSKCESFLERRQSCFNLTSVRT
jgi:hypothetical protein